MGLLCACCEINTYKENKDSECADEGESLQGINPKLDHARFLSFLQYHYNIHMSAQLLENFNT
jgi:hypothetical protein